MDPVIRDFVQILAILSQEEVSKMCTECGYPEDECRCHLLNTEDEAPEYIHLTTPERLELEKYIDEKILYRTPVGSFESWEEAADACESCDFDPCTCIENILEPNED